MKYGFTRIATAVPAITAGNCKKNSQEIISMIKDIAGKNVELVLFPELCLTSSNCGDLFMQNSFIQECRQAINDIADSTKGISTIAVFGAPVEYRNSIYNCAIAVHNGTIAGIVPKKILKNHGMCEGRWFSSGEHLQDGERINICGKDVPFAKQAIFSTGSYSFGIEIGNEAENPISPGAVLATNGADIILNPCSAEELADSNRQTRARLENSSRYCRCGYVHSNSGWGESTSRASYSGYSAIAECGNIIAEGERFKREACYTIAEIDVEKIRNKRKGNICFNCNDNTEHITIAQEQNSDSNLFRKIDATPFIPSEEMKQKRYEDIFMIQATALARRIEHTHANTCVIGISGGLDSTLALLVTEKACSIAGKKNSDIIAVTMPGFGTSGRTYNNAMKMMESLGVTIREISIKDACVQHFQDIGHDISNHDVTYENSQARERTQILMDIANMTGGIVIGTGDLSELALGWATYNGDHMSMYGVNASVPKTLMQHLVRWVAENRGESGLKEILLDIIETPISPELIPADHNDNIKQKTEDLVGPYELHDFFLYNFIHNGFSPEKINFLAQKAFDGNYDNATIKKWLSTFMRRFFIQQFKRSCMPDGPATGKCNLSPQGGWIMPADISGAHWNEECNNLEI